MLVFAKIKSVKQKIASLKKGKTIGFVPTMGALHQGHISLVERARKENDLVIVSIFVNPTQFDKQEDLVNYPKTIDKDLSMLKAAYCDLVFTPSAKEIYANKVSSEVFNFDGLEHEMEGKFRAGHFDGVGTIVRRLFEIVQPNRAYFGEKDYQQLQIIKKMVQQKDFKVQIIPCDIYREGDGLAMSSRNARLSREHRKAAPLIYKVLIQAKADFKTKGLSSIKTNVQKAFEEHPLLDLEYFEIADETTLQSVTRVSPYQKYRAFIAVFAGNVRLIDNISLE
jgi:pantoate--beta-alanine ligase